jgi:hypothetical protein
VAGGSALADEDVNNADGVEIPAYVEGEVIVKYKDGSTRTSAAYGECL